MIRALVFDFDGLVIDSERAIATAWRELYIEHGVEFPENVLRRMLGTREHDDLLFVHLEERLGRPVDRTAIAARNKARGVALANELPLLPGVAKHLDAAREAGIALAIASSSSRWWVEGHLERLGIRNRFAALATKEDAPRSKPDPGVYLAALRRLEVDAAEAVALEDSEPGLTAAKAAGMRCVAVPGSYTESMSFERADLVVASLAAVEPEDLWARLETV